MSYNESINKQEIGIVLSDAYKGQMAKVCIPVLTPDLKTDKPYKVRKNRPNTSNIVSDNAKNLDIRRYYRSNYINIKVTHKVFEQDKIYVTALGTSENDDFEMVGDYNGDK